MQTLITLNVLSVFNLLAIGVLLIAFEVFSTTFVALWFGIGFVLTAVISIFYEFNDGIWQIVCACIISLILLFLLRKKIISKFLKPEFELKDNFLNEEGIGEIKNSKVFFKGTYWEINKKINEHKFIEGEKVKIIKTKKNFAVIEKIEELNI